MDHLPFGIFTKDIVETGKSITLVNIPSLNFLGVPKKYVIIGNIKVDRYPKLLAVVINTVGVPVEYSLSDIVMNFIKLVIHIECGGETSLLRSLG